MFEDISSTIAFIEDNPFLVALIVIWSLAWKGFAMWKAGAVKKNPYWFGALLILNTYGIVDILYIFLFSEWKKIKKEKTEEKSKDA